MGVKDRKSIPPFAAESNGQRRCLFEQLRPNRLDQTLECAQLGSLNCDLVVLRLKHQDHMKLGGMLVHSTEEGETIHHRHLDVANQDIKLTSFNLAQGLHSTRSFCDTKSCLPKPMTVRVKNRRIIIDDKDSASGTLSGAHSHKLF